MSSQGILLVDGNSLGYVCHCRSSYVQTSPSGHQVQALDGFYERLWALYRQYPQHELVVLWDDQTPWRNAFFQPYKQNREQYEAQAEVRRQYKAALPLIQRSLSLSGCTQLVAGTLEADDLAYLMSKAKQPNQRVILCSSDTDWWQLVNEQISWLSCKSPYLLIELKNFTDTGYSSPTEALESKVLTGDKADNIPGFKDVGPARAKEILSRFEGLAGLTCALKEGRFEATKWYEKSLLTEGAISTIERNSFLMDLSALPEEVRLSNPILTLEKLDSGWEKEASTYANLLGLKNLSHKLAHGAAFFSWLSLHQSKAV